MSSTAPSFVASAPRVERLEVLFDELAELAGQRNAIDGRIVDIVAELDRDELWGMDDRRPVGDGADGVEAGHLPAQCRDVGGGRRPA